jgi:hypothetical protein
MASAAAPPAAPPQEEDEEEIPVEKYMPAGISEEEAIQSSSSYSNGRDSTCSCTRGPTATR